MHAGPLLFALDLAPTETKTSDCYFPPDGCYYGGITPTVDWRSVLVIDDTPSGGLALSRRSPVTAAGVPPFARATAPVEIVATAAVIPAADWPLVNCTSMESGCKSCVGPVPGSAAAAAAGWPRLPTTTHTTQRVSLIPFGATDVRIAVLPVHVQHPGTAAGDPPEQQ